MTTKLTFACEDYEWFQPAIQGVVETNAIDVDVVAMAAGGKRHRQMLDGEFDAAEFSFGTYLAGWPDDDFTAIPIFPRRFVPQSRMIVNVDSNVSEPADLEGKRIGIKTYQNTNAVWMKGILSEYYNVDTSTITWCTMYDEPHPVDADVEWLDCDVESVRHRVSTGDLDAVLLTKTAEIYPLPEHTEPLFSKDDERRYCQETGLLPVLHVVVIRDELLDDSPVVAEELQDLLRRSAKRSSERARYQAKYPLVWWHHYSAEEHDLFGDWVERSFSLEQNRSEVETFVEYASQQSLVAPDEADSEQLFHFPE